MTLRAVRAHQSDDVQRQILGADTVRQPPGHGNPHRRGLAHAKGARRQRMLGLARPDAPGERAERPLGAGVAVGTDERRARQDDGLFGRYHMADRSEEHTSELQSLMRTSYAAFCLKKKQTKKP